MNGLVPVSQGNKREQVQYIQLVDKFKDDWKDEWGGEEFNTTEESDEKKYPIPNEICKIIKELVDEHKEGRIREGSSKKHLSPVSSTAPYSKFVFYYFS